MMLSTLEIPLRKPRTCAGRAGRVAHGSRRQLQEYVNQLPYCLNEEIERQLPRDSRLSTQHVQWLSPLESEGFKEYRDAGVLEQLGMPEAAARLAACWPRMGPCWDGLAVVPQSKCRPQGVLLVDARSHPDEVDGPGWRAPFHSRPPILEAFRETREWLGAFETKAWTGSLFRIATRLAHLHFLRNRLGVPAWLVQVYFVNDPTGAASRADWLPVIAGVHARLGLCRRPPFTLDVFLPALHSD
jgi:hypothetical protein